MKKIVYFILTEFFCCIMSFFGCVFNEYIVLYCCGLERETEDEIAERARARASERAITQNELKMLIDNESTGNDENNDNIKDSNTVISINTSYDIKI